MAQYNTKSTIPGYTDKRGEWRPEEPISFAPLFAWPPKLVRFLKWISNYLFTWNLFYLALVLVSFNYFQPPLAEMKSFHISWISTLFVRNMALVWIIYGGWHFYLYIRKKRGNEGKYCSRWQSTDGSTFLWNNQVYDNIFWACASAVPQWTAYEALTFWLYANEKIPYLSFNEHPVWFVLLFLLIPIWRELHFYIIHRLIHWRPLYDRIHYLHHYNINPGPWSGLAMHPIEHLLYFSVVLIHWIVPSHPLHFLFNSQHTALTPAPSHTGFEGKVFKYLTFGSYFHYLHHRLFECNYGETTIPLDKWFGIFEDGSQTPAEKNETINAYHKLKVTRIVDETPEVKSFYLTSTDDSELMPAIPGQHLSFKIPFTENGFCKQTDSLSQKDIKYALRSYTISDILQNNEYRISVKKEAEGKVSNALHQSLTTGEILQAKAPKGSFTYLETKKKASVFIAAGIGITPILAMLKSIKKPANKIYLFLSAKEEKLLPFKDELKAINSKIPSLEVHVFFSKKPAQAMKEAFNSWHFHYGRLSVHDLKNILPEKIRFNCYACGPELMNQTIQKEISRWKGNRATVFSENFGIKDRLKNAPQTDKEITIHFTKTGRSINWDSEYSNILELAESNDIRLESGCTFGECGACSTPLTQGEVQYNFNTAAKPKAGNFLPCSCHPISDIYVDA